MKSRILRTVLTLLVPVVIEYIVKKLTTKKTETQSPAVTPTKTLENQ